MAFHDYFFSMSVAERDVFATSAGTSRGYLTQVAYENKRVELGFADVLVAVSGGRLGLDDLPLTENARQQRAIREAHQAAKTDVAPTAEQGA